MIVNMGLPDEYLQVSIFPKNIVYQHSRALAIAMEFELCSKYHKFQIWYPSSPRLTASKVQAEKFPSQRRQKQESNFAKKQTFVQHNDRT